MDKEKEIQEMARVIGENCELRDIIDGECHDIPGKTCDKCKTARQTAEKILELGYRKADEVRKETAQAILQELYDITFEMKDPYNGDVDEQNEVIDRAEILHTAEIYGVEVDE